MENFKEYLNDYVRGIEFDLNNLEKIEKTRKLHEEEFNYKKQLQGAYFTICEVQSEFRLRVLNDK